MSLGLFFRVDAAECLAIFVASNFFRSVFRHFRRRRRVTPRGRASLAAAELSRNQVRALIA